MQSFMWAEKLQQDQGIKATAEAAAKHGEALMHNEPSVSLEDVFKAKQGEPPYTWLQLAPQKMSCGKDVCSALDNRFNQYTFVFIPITLYTIYMLRSWISRTVCARALKNVELHPQIKQQGPSCRHSPQ